MSEKTKEFQFHVAHADDGSWLVCSEIEPVFCFICGSEGEAIARASETLLEYHERFLGEAVRITPPQPVRQVPIRQISAQKSYALAVA